MTIDKDKLRALAEAAGSGEWVCAIHEDCECVEGSEGFVASFDTLEAGRFIAAANPATILALLGEMERLDQFKTAYMEWSAKTDWVQGIATAKDLGKHSADVLREHFDQLKAERDALQSQVATLQADPGSWQSGYDTGRKSMAGHADSWRKEAAHYKGENERLRKALTEMCASREESARRAILNCVEANRGAQEICQGANAMTKEKGHD